MDSKNNLEKSIQAGLDELMSTLDGNLVKINEMVTQFVHETPEQFAKINAHVTARQWDVAATLIHKVKIRYGYLGLDHILEALGLWEDELRHTPIEGQQAEKITYFERVNEMILSMLRETAFYQPAGTTLTRLPLKGKCVLVAEDDEINRMVFTIFIEELGGEVVEAANGQDAVKLAQEKQPALIFMDVHMPFVSGLEAIKALRAQGVATPIISLSASTRMDEQRHSLDAGANEFLIKPAKREAIKQSLMKYLG